MDDNAGLCPMFGSRVPHRVRACLNCGELVPQRTSSSSLRVRWLINLTAIMIFFAYFWWLIVPVSGSRGRNTVSLSNEAKLWVGMAIVVVVIFVLPAVKLVWRVVRNSRLK